VILIGFFPAAGHRRLSIRRRRRRARPTARARNKLTQCTDALREPAEGLTGMLLLDAHPGNTVNAMRSLNPAVLDENDPSKIDPSLDPFDTRNGYNPNGLSVYAGRIHGPLFSRPRQARMKPADRQGAGHARGDQAGQKARRPTMRLSSLITTARG